MKRYIDVIVRWREDGQIIPLQLNWAPGQEFEIDRVLDIRQSASLKSGGHGMRYLCRIKGKERFIWLEENRWFVEGKD